MYECLVQRINLEFINTKATGYCSIIEVCLTKKVKVKVKCTPVHALKLCQAIQPTEGVEV